MRYLLYTLPAIGDLVVSLPVQKCILDNDSSAQVFWLVRPEMAPILDNVPGVSGVLRRAPDTPLEQLLMDAKPDVLLNYNYRDREIIPLAKKLGVPVRVARPRGLKQIFSATHRIWGKRSGSGRHEAEHALDFLRPLGFLVPAGIPPPPQLVLTSEEAEQGRADIQDTATPSCGYGFASVPSCGYGFASVPGLGVITRGSGGRAGAFPSSRWWENMLKASVTAGYNPIVLSPPDDSRLPPTSIRGLMGRLNACDAVLGISTGPTHLAAALNAPTLCLMGRRVKHGPDRWTPLGSRVGVLQYPGEEDDLGSGMDRLDVEAVLAQLDKLRINR